MSSTYRGEVNFIPKLSIKYEYRIKTVLDMQFFKNFTCHTPEEAQAQREFKEDAQN